MLPNYVITEDYDFEH